MQKRFLKTLFLALLLLFLVPSSTFAQIEEPSGYILVNSSTTAACEVAPSGNACHALLRWVSFNVPSTANVAITSDRPTANTIVATTSQGILYDYVALRGVTQFFFYVDGKEIASPVSIEASCTRLPLTIWQDTTCVCVNGATGDCTYCPHRQYMMRTIGGQERCDICPTTAPYYDSASKRCTNGLFINSGNALSTILNTESVILDWVSNADACVVNDIEGNYIGTGNILGQAESGGFDYSYVLTREVRQELTYTHKKENNTELGYEIHCTDTSNSSRLIKGQKIVEVHVPTLKNWIAIGDEPDTFPSGVIRFTCEHSDRYRVVNLSNNNEVLAQAFNAVDGNEIPVTTLSPQKATEWKIQTECYYGDLLGDKSVNTVINNKMLIPSINGPIFGLDTFGALRCGGDTIPINYSVIHTKGKECRINASLPPDRQETEKMSEAISKTQRDLDTYANTPQIFDVNYGAIQGTINDVYVGATTIFNLECRSPATGNMESLWTDVARVMCTEYR